MKKSKGAYTKVVKAEFDRQWKEVIRNYPLVAMAFIIQKKEFARLVRERLLHIQELRPIFTPKIDERVAVKVSMRLTTCFRNFEIAVGGAQTDAEARDAFEGLSKCLSRKPD